MNVFATLGDLGDCVALLPVIRQLGGGKLIITEDLSLPPGQGPRESMRGARYAFLEPLLAAQPYITSVRWSDKPGKVSHDLRRFRSIYKQTLGISLSEWQARYIGVHELDLSPWLAVEPDPISKGRVVVARSSRYHSGMWRLDKIVERYGDRLLFVGLESEHVEFCREADSFVEWLPTRDAMELAGVIAGADFLIAGQSLPWWLGAGLGVSVIQESYPRSLNSVINRTGLQYSRTAAEIRGLKWPD